ncbi:MAG: two-component system, cell cycle sensor histidine kinase and response regulator CckA [Verrucomicrobiota bacterium]|jgi:CheY-like chemotaxis protein
MKTDGTHKPSPEDAPTEAASELNNLLEIISGTSAAIENIWAGNDGSEKYFDMLRTSVDRAAKVTAQLVEHAGGADKKVLFHPELSAFAKTKREIPRAPSKARHVLVVDDEPMALVLAKRILTEAGLEVTTAQSGFECLDLFRKQPHQFDLILLDLSMPFMDGEETFGRLRTIRPDVIVLLSTGFIAQERLDRMLAAGMAGFLRKPHRPDELVAHVRSVLESVKMSRAGCVDSVASSF